MGNLKEQYGYYTGKAAIAVIPLAAIFIFRWNLADIFLLFFTELIAVGFFAFVKLICAPLNSPLKTRLTNASLFALVYAIVFILVFVALGNMVSSSMHHAEPALKKETVYIVFAAYATGFFSAFIFSGKFRKVHYREIMTETLVHAGILFLLLLILLVPFSHWVMQPLVNYFPAVALVLVKNISDYFALKFAESKLIAGSR